MRTVNRAENWERAYQAFQQVNFAAWDFATIKESMLDYLKVYYPEDFNDYIESSEFIMLLEIFAYLGELMAYRIDLNAHENFINTAQRKESVLRLAKLLSYSASRNIPARGLVKLSSISTTQRIVDSSGTDLANRTIIWNDQNNPNWKEQFTLVMNAALDQPIGTVLASDRIQVDDVVFELYTLRNSPLPSQTIPFSVTVSGQTLPMEAVSCELDDSGPYEKRPRKNQNISIVYANDGLGDSSPNSGFFILVKQGRLGRAVTDFDGATPNLTYDVNIENCNETDVWLNNIDPDTGNIIVGDDVTATTLLGEWGRVDLANSQNVIFNTNPETNKYEVETLANDAFRIIFGDGKFANIPSGRFEVWYRVSANTDTVIPTNALQNLPLAVRYRDPIQREQTLSFAVSLTAPIQNAAPSEDIDRIRRIAPAVYYTQDRMVNGRDYNEFMLQDNTILKLRAINRTFAGDSKYIAWKDPRDYYDNVKLFGDDLVVYFNTFQRQTIINDGLPEPDGAANEALINTLIFNHIQPYLETEAFFLYATIGGLPPNSVRKVFSTSDIVNLSASLNQLIENTPEAFWINFIEESNLFTFTTSVTDNWIMRIESAVDNKWKITTNNKSINVISNETKFFISNNSNSVTEYDTLNPNFDNIVILKANTGTAGCALTKNYPLRVLRQLVVDNGQFIGTDDPHQLMVIPEDENSDGSPDQPSLNYLIGPTDFVYFKRDNTNSPWVFVPYSVETLDAYEEDQQFGLGLWKRESGRESVNFLWLHRTPRYHLVDPAASNIIDTYIIARGYYYSIKNWLNGRSDVQPIAPTPFQLRQDYNYMLDNKMISDTVVLHPGKIKVILGSKAKPELQAYIKVVRSRNRTLTNNQVKTAIVDAVEEFFNIEKWEFGETFFFSELAAFIHTKLPVDLDSIVIVPRFQTQIYGDLQQILCTEDEIIQPSITTDDIEIVETLSPTVLKQNV